MTTTSLTGAERDGLIAAGYNPDSTEPFVTFAQWEALALSDDPVDKEKLFDPHKGLGLGPFGMTVPLSCALCGALVPKTRQVVQHLAWHLANRA